MATAARTFARPAPRRRTVVRSALLIGGTAVVAGGAFAAYWMLQPTFPTMPQPTTPSVFDLPTIGGGDNAMGPGQDPWVRTFDSRGRLSNRFRAKQYTPQAGGLVQVTEPQAIFYMRDGQELHLRGRDGLVFMRNTPKPGETMAGGSFKSPNRGRLNHVTLDLFESGQTTPTLTLTVNNVSFNNETYRIATESFTSGDGQTIAPDQVPVVVRGQKYDFDGRGLVVRWNDVDQRLELLEIAHGERVVVRDPDFLGKTSSSKTTLSPTTEPTSPAAPAVVASASIPPTPEPAAPTAAIVTTAPSTKPAAAAPTTAPSKKREQPYRVTFFDNVQIVQGPQTLARGVQTLQIDLLMRGQDRGRSPATAPATQAAPTEASSPTTSTTAAEAAPPPTTTPATTQSSDVAVAAATQPAGPPPLVLYWTGKLTIKPLEGPAVHLAAGERVVTMAGAPVVLTRDLARATCASAVYHSDNGAASLLGSPERPDVLLEKFKDAAMNGPTDAVVTARRVDYDPAVQIATVFGPARARLTAPADESTTSTPQTVKADQALDARWNGLGKLHFLGSGDAMNIDRLQLAGDVDVRYPRLVLQSQSLDTQFEQVAAAQTDAPTTRPASRLTVRHVTAADAVYCAVQDENGGTRKIWSDRLDLDGAMSDEGQFYARQIEANGRVRAVDADQELKSGQLVMAFKPSDRARQPVTRPADANAFGGGAMELESLVARQAVQVSSPNGKAASEELIVHPLDAAGERKVELNSPKLAEVVDAKGNTIRGPHIEMEPSSGRARVVGAGSLHALQESTSGAKPQPMDVTWTESAVVDNPQDRIDVTGDVRAAQIDADGGLNTSRSDRVRLVLAKKPTTQPAVAATRPASRPSGDLAATDVFKDKVVSAVLLQDNAVVNSKLADADGAVLREFQLSGPRINYEMARNRLVVPAAGKMLVRDHRPPQKAADPKEQQGGLGSNRGVAAFQWSDSLVYDQLARQAVMSGNTIVAYQGDAPNTPPLRMTSDRVTADFVPKPVAAKAQAPANVDQTSKLDLKLLTSEGNVHVFRENNELAADKLTFDPATEWIVANGSPRRPALFTEQVPQRAPRVFRAGEIHWNTRTWNVKLVDFGARIQQ